MNLSTTAVVGISSEEYWPQVFQHHDDSATCIVAFCIRDGGDVRTRGKAFVADLEQLPFDDRVALAGTLQRIVEKHADVLGSFCAGYFAENKVLLWAKANGRVVLRRGEKSGNVIESDAYKIVEGSVREHDVFVFGTEAFFAIVSDPFQGCSKSDGVTSCDDVSSTLVPILHAHAENAKAAGYVVAVGADGKSGTTPGAEVAIPGVTPTTSSTANMAISTPLADKFSFLRNLSQRFTLPKIPKPHFVVPSKNAKILMILVVSFAVLVVSLFVGWSKRQASLRERRVQELLQPFQQNLTEAKAKEPIDIGASRQLAQSVVKDAQAKLGQISEKSYEYSRLKSFIGEAETYFNTISGEKSLDTLPIFYDLQLVKADFIAQSVAYADNTLFFLDKERNAAIALQVDKKQPSGINTDGVSESKDIAATSKNVYVLGDNVYDAGKVVVKKADSWKNSAFVRVFGSNLYILDKGTRELRKYAGSDSTFSGGTNWIKSATGLDFDAITSLAIDGKVWITTSKGEIFSLVQGTKSPFQVKGLLKPFSSSLMVYTTVDSDKLYLLEPAAQRLVILDKEGNYLSSISSKDIGAATGFVIDFAGKTAYVSAGSVVYSIPLE